MQKSAARLRDVSSYFCGTLVRLSANNRAKEKRALGDNSPRAASNGKFGNDGAAAHGAGKGERGAAELMRECAKKFGGVLDAPQEHDATAWLWRCGAVARHAPKLFAAIEQRAAQISSTHAQALLYAESPQGRLKLKLKR